MERRFLRMMQFCKFFENDEIETWTNESWTIEESGIEKSAIENSTIANSASEMVFIGSVGNPGFL